MTNARRWTAWGALATTIGLAALTLYLRLVGRAPIPPSRFLFGDLALVAIVVLVLACAAVGCLLAVRLPRHRVGWLFLVVGVSYAGSIALSAYAFDVLDGASPSSNDHRWRAAMWAADATQQLAGFMTWMLAALFPDGRAPFRLPAWFPRVFVSLTLVVGVAYVLRPGPSWLIPEVQNPIAAPGWLGVLAATITSLAAAVMPVFVLGSIAGLIRRARSGDHVQLQQVKWFVLAAVVAVALGLVLLPTIIAPGSHPLGEVPLAIFLLSLTGIPIAAAVAILRYRLYDIDVVIRRTLVYGAVVAILGLVYVALVLGLQTALSGITGVGPLPVALSTLAIAALFGPVRARVRDVVDRRFYRSHYDAQRTLEQFAGRVRDQVELETVGATLVEVAVDAVRPASAAVWVRALRP